MMNISEQNRCNPQSHRIFDRSSLATATSPQNDSPQNLLTVQLDTKPPRSYASPQSSGILYAKSPSSQEFAIPITMGAPTKFHEPTLRLHPHRRIDFHRSGEISFRIATLPATLPTARPRADPAIAPP